MLIDNVFRSFATGISKKCIGTMEGSSDRATGQALYSGQFMGIAIQSENWLNYGNDSVFLKHLAAKAFPLAAFGEAEDVTLRSCRKVDASSGSARGFSKKTSAPTPSASDFSPVRPLSRQSHNSWPSVSISDFLYYVKPFEFLRRKGKVADDKRILITVKQCFGFFAITGAVNLALQFTPQIAANKFQ